MSHHFEKWMKAEAKAYWLRGELERLRSSLPPDTRPRCWVGMAQGQCSGKALESGLCAAHEYESVC